MGVIDTLRETIVLIQKADNIDLLRQMVALQEQVHSLYDENRTLRDRLALREKAVFKGNAYWVEGEGPFCSACCDGNERLIRLHTRVGYLPRCPVCKLTAVDPTQPPPEPQPRRISRSDYLSR